MKTKMMKICSEGKFLDYEGMKKIFFELAPAVFLIIRQETLVPLKENNEKV